MLGVSFNKVGGGFLLFILQMSQDMSFGEKIKFENLYNKYKNTLFYQAMNIVKNEKDAEDVLQNAFIKIAKNIKSVKSIDSKETLSFLIVVTRNTAFDYVRKRSKISELPLSEIEETSATDNALEEVVEKLEYKTIVSAIISIPHPYNEVLYLHFVKDYSIKKTADVLDRKTATVKMQLVRGKRMLIEKLTEALYE